MFCFEKCHAHQTDIPRFPHRFRRKLYLSVKQCKFLVTHQPLKISKVCHVGTRNVGNFMLSSNIWHSLLYLQPTTNYIKPRIRQKVILCSIFNPEVGSQFWSHFQNFNEFISFRPFDNFLDLLFFWFPDFIMFHSTLIHIGPWNAIECCKLDTKVYFDFSMHEC